MLTSFTSFVPKKESSYHCKRQFLAQLDVAMGGRIAEELFFGNTQITTGCGSDLNNATKNAYGLIYNYGMGDFGLIVDANTASDKLRGEFDKAVQGILKVRLLGKLREDKKYAE